MPTDAIVLFLPQPTGCLEPVHLKKELPVDKKPGTSQWPEIQSHTKFADMIAGENIPHSYKVNGKAENLAQIYRSKAFLTLKSDHKLENSARSLFSPSRIGLEIEEMPSGETKSYDESKLSTTFHKYEEDESLKESVSFSFQDMKQEDKKFPQHEQSYTFELQNSSNVLWGKDNDSGYMSEQDLVEKATDTPNAKFKSWRVSEREDSLDESCVAMTCGKENNHSTGQAEAESKDQNKDPFIKGHVLDRLQFNFLSKVVKNKCLVPEQTWERKKDKPQQLLSANQEFPKYEDLDICDRKAVSNDYAEKSRFFQIPQRESEHLQKKVMDLENENADLKRQIKPLTNIIQSLTEQNSKYQRQIKDLHDEKTCIQEKLVKSDSDCKECIKEVKKLLKKCGELQQHKLSLEEKQDQLCAQNQRLMRNLDGAQKKDQKAQESLALIAQEKDNLVATIASLGNQVSTFQEENKTLENDIFQLSEKKGLLEKELKVKQNEIEQLKEKEKAALSDMQDLFRMTQTLNDDKLTLEKTLKELLDAKETLQNKLEEAQSRGENAEEKLRSECKNARMETGVLKTNLSNRERECERLTTEVTVITENNWNLKKELQEYKQEAAECKNKLRQLSEEFLLMENEMRTTENEKDVLQFELRRLHRYNTNLRDQVTALFNGRCNSESQQQTNNSADATEIREEMASSYQHISLKYDLPGMFHSLIYRTQTHFKLEMFQGLGWGNI